MKILNLILFKENCFDIYYYNNNLNAIQGSNGNFLINNCLFQRSNTYNGNGGVIYFSGSNSILNINDCIFYFCSSTNWGGAIYFYCENLNSNFYLNKVCAYQCWNNGGEGQFACIYVGRSINNFENITLLSISKTPKTELGSYSFVLNYGNENLNNFNSSFNKGTSYSGLFLYICNQFKGKYCTFSNNEASGILWLYNGFNDRDFTYSNFVKNNPFSNGVFVLSSSTSFILNSNIFFNNLNNLFKVDSGSSLNLINNIFDNIILSTLGNVIINSNNTFSFINTYNINYFSTFFCQTEKNLIFNSKKKNSTFLKYFNILFFIIYV